MNLLEAVSARHSVRHYTAQALEEPVIRALKAAMEQANRESGLSIRLFLEEQKAFSGLLVGYGFFQKVRNYLALVGPKCPDLAERCGYFGERLVLQMQTMGLNSCWVGGTYNKGRCPVSLQENETLLLVIALGYGASSGKPHRSKPRERFYQSDRVPPDWFFAGLDAAMLAPTALNQQRFRFLLKGDTVTAVALPGPFTNVDLGIVRCHFELGAAGHPFCWGIPADQ